MKLSVILAFILIGCSNSIPAKEKRIRLIERTISALKANDKLTLFQIIDTLQCFAIYGKEGFVAKIDRARLALTDCSVSDWQKDMEEEREAAYHTKYTIPICSSSGANKTLMIELTFAEYRSSDRIDYFDVHFGSQTSGKLHSRWFKERPLIAELRTTGAVALCGVSLVHNFTKFTRTAQSLLR
jgi:hypothetical protein